MRSDPVARASMIDTSNILESCKTTSMLDNISIHEDKSQACLDSNMARDRQTDMQTVTDR